MSPSSSSLASARCRLRWWLGADDFGGRLCPAAKGPFSLALSEQPRFVWSRIDPFTITASGRDGLGNSPLHGRLSQRPRPQPRSALRRSCLSSIHGYPGLRRCWPDAPSDPSVLATAATGPAPPATPGAPPRWPADHAPSGRIQELRPPGRSGWKPGEVNHPTSKAVRLPDG